MSVRLVTFAALAALSFTSLPATAATNLIVNGSFENNWIGWLTRLRGGLDAMVTDTPRAGGPTDGLFHTEFTFFTPRTGAYLYQPINTKPGASYTLSFDASSVLGAKLYSVSWTDSLSDSVTYVVPEQLLLNFEYETFELSLVALGSRTILEFGFYDDFGYAVLDNVILTETGVPEPATWAMLIAGFGFIGLAARRRRTAIAS